MKLTAHIPPNVRLDQVCAAMRSLGLELRYRDGDLIAGDPEHGNVVRLNRYRRQISAGRVHTPPGPEVA